MAPKSRAGTARAGRAGVLGALVIGTLLAAAPFAHAQVDPAGGATTPEAEAPDPAAAPALPVFATLGAGYGQRFDPCAQCTSPQNVESFTGHLSVGKYLSHGVGIGVDASVWQRGHPGAPAGADSTTAGTPTKLINRLGNASLTLSWETWHVFVRAGVGVALGQQDVQDTTGVVTTATGMGVGYSIGGGATLPLASLVSLAFFVNWNAGSYDLATPTEVLERGVKHEVIELGFGLTLR